MNAEKTNSGKMKYNLLCFAVIIAAAAICCFAAYRFGLFGDSASDTDRSAGIADTVRSELEKRGDEDSVIKLDIIGIEIDEEETERIIADFKGSELAESRGWSESDVESMTAVRAEYYAEYDHAKTFMDDGRAVQYFYVMSGGESGCIIADISSPNVSE